MCEKPGCSEAQVQGKGSRFSCGGWTVHCAWYLGACHGVLLLSWRAGLTNSGSNMLDTRLGQSGVSSLDWGLPAAGMPEGAACQGSVAMSRCLPSAAFCCLCPWL